MRAAAGTGRRTVAHLFEFRTGLVDVPAHAVAEFEEAAEALVRESRRRRATRLFSVLRDRSRPGRFLCAAVFDSAAEERALFATSAGRRFAAVLLAADAAAETTAWEAVAGV